MSFQLVRADDVAPQPWRNGGGVTRELVAWPDARDWQLRISVADIEADGQFSAFPGVRRWCVVLKGAGVELLIDGQPHRLQRGDDPLAFDGASPASCHLLAGPTRDLNLMLRGLEGSMRVAEDAQFWAPPAASRCALFTAVAGCCRVDGGEIELPPYALLWFDEAPSRLAFVAGQRPAAAIGWWLLAAAAEAAT